MELIDAVNLAKELMLKHGLHDWTFKLNDNKARLGVCKYGEKTIELSIYHINQSKIDEVKNTILHEIAHALVGSKEGHNLVWKFKAVSIGCNGKRLGRMTVKRECKGHCPNCKREINMHRRRKLACRACCNLFNGGKYDSKYSFVWE